MSCYRDLNPGPLPYQGSALPLSYNSKKQSGRRGSNPRPSAWKANALSTELLPHSCQSCHSDRGQRWIRTTEGVSQQIYSLPHLATLVFALKQVENVELKVNSFRLSSPYYCQLKFQISHGTLNSPFSTFHFFEPLVGFEPTTPRLQITCSGQLS